MRSLLLSVALLLTACTGGWEQTGRGVVAYGGMTLETTDEHVAPVYIERAQDCLNTSLTLEEYEECMTPLNAVEEALRASYEALEAMENALDAYRAGLEGMLIDTFFKALAVFENLLSALEVIGERVPELNEFLSKVRAFVTGLLE
jgi:hypothetical protein